VFFLLQWLKERPSKLHQENQRLEFVIDSLESRKDSSKHLREISDKKFDSLSLIIKGDSAKISELKKKLDNLIMK
jgi:hypothetical protein